MFIPCKIKLAALLGLCGEGGIIQHFLQYAILFNAQTIKSSFMIIFPTFQSSAPTKRFFFHLNRGSPSKAAPKVLWETKIYCQQLMFSTVQRDVRY